MTIFYGNNSLKDTLIVSIKNNVDDVFVVNRDNYSLIKSNDEIVGINIFHFSQYIKINPGLIYPTDQIIDLVKQITEVDLALYIEPTFVICQIKEYHNIENTHLHVCKVDIGSKIIDVVCGAKNVQKDLITVCALDNSILPNGKTINSGELMSNKSDGMLCSYKELNISINQPGIIELPIDKYKNKIGKPFYKLYSNTTIL